MSPALLAILAATVVVAPPPVIRPAIPDVGIDEHLGAQLPLDLAFRDQAGNSVRLNQFIDGRLPTILVLAYYECPMLCGLVLNGVAQTIHQLDWKPGRDFRLLTISFDVRDTPVKAARRQLAVLGGAGDWALASQWPFLVGQPPEIESLTKAVGFRYELDAATRQLAHPAAIFILTPDGHISRYLYGVSFRATDLKLALLEAGQGKTGTSFERLILTCFHYDPATRRYGPYLVGFFRTGSALIFLTLAFAIVRLRRREKAERRL